RLAICAWLTTDTGRPEHVRLVDEVCRGMLCPSLGSEADYTRWMRDAGFDNITAEDITRSVERTWVHCSAVVDRPEIRALRWLMDEKTKAFVLSFAAIRKAYAEGAMAYGRFTARKPGQCSEALLPAARRTGT